MPMFRPSPQQQHLSNYWNALTRNAPADELARLGALVAPTDRAAIGRARALHQRRRPDPAFVAQLETTLMHAFPSVDPLTLPIAPTRPVSPNGRFAPSTPQPESHHRSRGQFGDKGFAISALQIALVVLVILASVAGIWLVNDRNNDTHVLAPPVATPTSDASPNVPMYRGNAARTGVMPGPGVNGEPLLLWHIETGAAIHSATAAVDGVLYVGVADGTIRAVDMVTGNELWTFGAGSGVNASPSVANGIVYVGSEDGTLYALSASNGVEQWSVPNMRSQTQANVVDGVIYTGTLDDAAVALDAATGEELWRTPLDGKATRSPSVANGFIYIGNDQGQLMALDAASGTRRWTFQTEGGGLLNAVAVANNVAYQTTFDGRTNHIYAIDAVSGEQLWDYSVEGNQGYLVPAIGADTLYVPSADSSLYALDIETGEVRWNFATGGAITAAPAFVGDVLYIAGTDDQLYAVDTESGVETWRFAIDGAVDYGPVISRGVAYVGTASGSLYAIIGANAPEPLVHISAMQDDPTPQTESPATPAASPEAQLVVASFVWQSADSYGLAASPVIAPNGTIWISNGPNSQFEIFAADGTHLESWGTVGDGDGEFNFARSNGDSHGAISFAPDGSFYVADLGNQRIQHFAADRTFLHAWGRYGSAYGQFITPIDVAVNSEGQVIVDDDSQDRVQVFAADGSFLFAVGGSGSEPGRLDFQGFLGLGPDDSIWVADPANQRIQQWSSEGDFLQAIDTSSSVVSPVDVTVDGNGNLFVVDIDDSQVVVLDAAGAVLGRWDVLREDGARTFPSAIAVGADGMVYVTGIDGGHLLAYQVEPFHAIAAGATPASLPAATPAATPIATPVS